MKGESLRPIEIAGESDSDKDLVINTLTESLQIHKEIMERLHSEREAFIEKMERERNEEQETTRKEKEQALQAMEEQLERYERLESAYNLVVAELETKKTEYKKMESRFYDHVRRWVVVLCVNGGGGGGGGLKNVKDIGLMVTQHTSYR